MTMEELRNKVADWYEALNGREPTEEDINDFCKVNATCLEEYMYLWELLVDMFSIEN